jgi:transposase
VKIQEVILGALGKKITWWQAAEIIGISDRSMRRWRQRYEEHGYDGRFDRRRGKPSPKRVPLARAEAVLRLYQEKYADLHVRHFHEKLQEAHGIKLSYTWVKLALQGAGLVKQGRKRGVHRKRRARRPLPGMLLHLDGSRHQGFQDQRWHDLIEIVDDASSETYYAQLVEEESTRTVRAALREVIERQGRLPQELPLAGISGVEKANHFLRERYIGEMNERFSVPAAQTGHAFVAVRGQDLDHIFSAQQERVVAKDNTVRLADRTWWGATRPKASLRRLRKKRARHAVKMTPRGKPGKLKERVSHPSHRAWKSGTKRRIPTFPQRRRQR